MIASVIGDVLTAVMPKGVEHLSAPAAQAQRTRVLTAVMPKGVEHITEVSWTSIHPSVLTAVMPKGVEHFAAAHTSCSAAQC